MRGKRVVADMNSNLSGLSDEELRNNVAAMLAARKACEEEEVRACLFLVLVLHSKLASRAVGKGQRPGG